MRQASLRAAQVEASSLEGQVAACESEQVTLQQQMRKTDASNAALAQRLSSLEEHRRQETSCASAQTRQSEGAKADLERQLQAERAARQTQLERVASALRASAAEEAEARARFEAAVESDAARLTEVAQGSAAFSGPSRGIGSR